LRVALGLAQQPLLHLMGTRQQPEQRGIRTGCAMEARAHDEPAALADASQLNGDREDEDVCAATAAVGFTIGRTVPMEDRAKSRRTDMEGDTVVPDLNAGNQGADDAALFV
jgi:hypothetical protein